MRGDGLRIQQVLAAALLPFPDEERGGAGRAAVGREEAGRGGAIGQQVQRIAQDAAERAVNLVQARPGDREVAAACTGLALGLQEVLHEPLRLVRPERPGPVHRLEAHFHGSQRLVEIPDDLALPLDGFGSNGGPDLEPAASFAQNPRGALDVRRRGSTAGERALPVLDIRRPIAGDLDQVELAAQPCGPFRGDRSIGRQEPEPGDPGFGRDRPRPFDQANHRFPI